MDLLTFLCERPNQVISADEIVARCWANAFQGDNSLHKALSQLRHALGDSAVSPRYIETIRKRGYRTIADISPLAHETSDPLWRDRSPFRGLEAFEPEHAPVFCGRDSATHVLKQMLLAQLNRGCAMLLVLGPSGSGKTSLVQAGLLAHLSKGREAGIRLRTWLTFDCADLGGASLFAGLGSVLLDCEIDGKPLFHDQSAASLALRLAEDIAWVEAHLGGALAGQRIFLFIDRLEAIFRIGHLHDKERAAFFECIERLGQMGIIAIIACRNDFYHHVMGFAAMRALKARGGHYDLNPPDALEMARIIRQPAHAAGLRFETDATSGASLDDLLCHATHRGTDALPLLEYCLQELYRRRDNQNMLRLAVFHELGGIEGAISVRAEEVIATLSKAEVHALPQVLSRLVMLTDDQSAVTARHAPWASLKAGAEQDLVKALVEARLFVTDFIAGTPTYGVAHEALLRRWPRAQDWIEKHRESLRLRTRIGAQAARWREHGMDSGLLLPPGIQARQAKALVRQRELDLDRLELDFIAASVRKVERYERVRLLISVLVVTLALLAGALGVAAFAAQRRAERHRGEAEGLVTYMLGELVDKVRPLGRLDLLDSVSERALLYLSDMSRLQARPVALTQRSKALQVIAEVKIARGDPAAATAALLAARQILGELARMQPSNREVLANLGANAFWLGQIHFDHGEWDAASRQFQDYLDFSNQVAQLAPSDPDTWIEQSYAHNSLGSTALKRGKLALAATEFSASVALKSRALERKRGDPTLTADLADSISWLASTKTRLGELDSAMRLFRREQALLQPLQDAVPQNGLWMHRYAFALWHQSELYMVAGKKREAMILLERSALLLGRLVHLDPSNRNWRMDMNNAELKLLELDIAGTDGRASPERLDALYLAFDRLLAQEPRNTTLARLTASALVTKAQSQRGHGQLAKARATLAPALAALSHQHTTAPADTSIADALATALLVQAQIEQALGATAESEQACRAVEDLFAPSVATSLDFRILSAWVRAQYCLRTPQRAAPFLGRLDKIGFHDPRFLEALHLTDDRKEIE
ncbi:transcriptional regulator [Massilia forsythiae]|uniref:Transcriptional regulator n=2 Tax=Massilia forsythiae TaxID=2728020 RepID=A0A7Z2VYW2_9BURK|nr:transcriptional regulator [Massilia forsythiae]